MYHRADDDFSSPHYLDTVWHVHAICIARDKELLAWGLIRPVSVDAIVSSIVSSIAPSTAHRFNGYLACRTCCETCLVGCSDASGVKTSVRSFRVDNALATCAIVANGSGYPRIVLGAAAVLEMRHLGHGLVQFEFITEGVNRDRNGTEPGAILGHRVFQLTVEVHTGTRFSKGSTNVKGTGWDGWTVVDNHTDSVLGFQWRTFGNDGCNLWRRAVIRVS